VQGKTARDTPDLHAKIVPNLKKHFKLQEKDKFREFVEELHKEKLAEVGGGAQSSPAPEWVKPRRQSTAAAAPRPLFRRASLAPMQPGKPVSDTDLPPTSENAAALQARAREKAFQPQSSDSPASSRVTVSATLPPVSHQPAARRPSLEGGMVTTIIRRPSLPGAEGVGGVSGVSLPAATTTSTVTTHSGYSISRAQEEGKREHAERSKQLSSSPPTANVRGSPARGPPPTSTAFGQQLSSVPDDVSTDKSGSESSSREASPSRK
jgi:hypothetical protein